MAAATTTNTVAATTLPYDAKPGITFAHQDSLPKLPIAELEDVCRKYLEAVKPLQTKREHQETVAAVREFLKTDGPELQERLKKYAGTKSSYIEQFWYDSYLNYDNPVVLNLNPFFLLEDDPTPSRRNQVTRAASLTISSLSFVRALRREELPPDKIRGTPLCMYQYPRIFSSARIPTENGCVMQSDPTARHIVVMCRSQMYWFDVLDENSDIIITERDLQQNLQAIIDDAQMTPIQLAAKSAVGVLSTENRRIWANLRDILTQDGKDSNNSECLRIVDTALFVLCLDQTSPSSAAELSMNMLCGTNVVEKGVQVGTCTNRWYDKLQIIVCKNGSAGINFEHTGVDGHTVLRMASDVYTDTILRFARTINGTAPSLWASQSPDPNKRDPASFGDVCTTPHKLEWTMVSELSMALRFAETRLADLINQNEFEVLEFSHYGKNFITSMGFSPDAFVQMAFQAAYYGLYGRVESTYEPAMTKVFLHGRTEAIRTVSTESVEFVKKFCENAPASEKVDALRKACMKHTAVTKECAKGLGQDRHLYALFCVWQRGLDEEALSQADEHSRDGSISPDGYSYSGSYETEGSPTGRSRSFSDCSSITGSPAVKSSPPTVPSIFADPAWDRINNTILSTSNCGNPSLRAFGFGPTSGDGFGIGYIIKEESISISVSSKHRQTKRFVDTLQNYFLEIRHLLRATQHKEPPRSMAREAEKLTRARGPAGQGRGIRTAMHRQLSGKVLTVGNGSVQDGEASDTSVRSEDGSDGESGMLGGYGYFDAGSVARLLEKRDKPSTEKLPGRRAVGRMVKLTDH
ncbi:Choline/Carnitine o-acyltransferase-domain-containing protein [Sphaerosporella brunnea]|uniref:Choline/Carnitine o-acyltransferase-domain-containing protein n=1 Tax=Sphaerosporella brunnea TaxID=1250544 RepID=A0A5J5F8L7_9PEZI|nr:Choline/Carnitine o-acyltransferase-domain-containing protein [Sphaerosporella brunnea]